MPRSDAHAPEAEKAGQSAGSREGAGQDGDAEQGELALGSPHQAAAEPRDGAESGTGESGAATSPPGDNAGADAAGDEAGEKAPGGDRLRQP